MRGAGPMLGLAAACALCAPAAAQQHDPSWRSFAGVRLGDRIDDLLALGAVCVPVGTARANVEATVGAKYPVEAVAQYAFGLSLPDRHTDTIAVRAALGNATVCALPIVDGRAVATAVAIDRIVVGATSLFIPKDSSSTVNVDTVRALVRRAWGRPSVAGSSLDSWLSPHYRGYLLIQQTRGWTEPFRWSGPLVRLIMVDVAACTAFDRRVHQLSHQGEPLEC
ncbi:MAG TPA: hypothetical protein VLV16_06680 [Gemmatimonadales bacterium]|nr:hypothetical protein [Gemmatimonadales bacterium]